MSKTRNQRKRERARMILVVLFAVSLAAFLVALINVRGAV